MVRVRLSSLSNNCLQFEVEGHAGHGKKGTDPVCAAISVLTLTFLNGLERELQAEIVGHFDDGECSVEITVIKEKSNDLNLLTKVFRYGFERLVREFPDCLVLENRN
ncbi:MAG: ribosomal-processing cysteine protease Prp [Candidatus Riflebacteria bacterium]|nr:ribosomal-processing cysteine protease Prp [Candidatus Riflebacteria bacterium]